MSALSTDLAAVDAATDALLRTATALPADSLDAATLCEGWTRGHVLAHLSRNADAVARLARWAVTGERQEMYAGGTAGRDAEIEAGAGRPLEEQVEDLRRSADALAAALARLETGTVVDAVEMRGGYLLSPAALPFVRLREVVYHHVDLEAGYTFADVPGPLLVRFLADAVARLGASRRAPTALLRTLEGEQWEVRPARTGSGPTGEEAGDRAAHPVVTGTRAGLLLWLARQVEDQVSCDGPLPSLPRGA